MLPYGEWGKWLEEAEREQFIVELDVKHMTTRELELEKAVEERNQALKERDEARRKVISLWKINSLLNSG